MFGPVLIIKFWIFYKLSCFFWACYFCVFPLCKQLQAGNFPCTNPLFMHICKSAKTKNKARKLSQAFSFALCLQSHVLWGVLQRVGGPSATRPIVTLCPICNIVLIWMGLFFLLWTTWNKTTQQKLSKLSLTRLDRSILARFCVTQNFESPHSVSTEQRCTTWNVVWGKRAFFSRF